MEKLTEMGKLYLHDYYVLTEAQEQSHDYLDTTLECIIERIEDRKEELLDLGDDYYWETWNNKSNLGYYQIYLKSKVENKLLRGKRVDIMITYRDVRHTNMLNNPTSVEIYIGCKSFFHKKVNQISQIELDEAYSKAIETGTPIDYKRKKLFSTEISLNLLSASDSADIIADELIERANGIAAFVESILKKPL